MGVNLFGGGDSHHSNVADLGAMFDPTSWFLPEEINPHTYAKPVATATNELLSPVFKPINQFHTAITPGKAWLDEKVPLLKAWNDTVENRPADALGIAAATVFGGGALAGAGGAGGASLGAAGDAAATSALTPAFTAGAATGTTGATAGAGLGAAGSAYGSSLLGLGGTTAGAGAAATAAGGGIGGLGAAGTAAGTAALAPSLYGLGTQQSLASYMGQLYDKANTAKGYYDKGRTVYDALSPSRQQPTDGPMQITNPMDSPDRYSFARYLRGY